MTDLSDRQHDVFDNPAKMACREGNLRVLREAAFLLWDGDRTRLRCDWCELMGETGLLTLDLLERQGVLAPGGFVGIDLDLARIDGFRQRRPDLNGSPATSTNVSTHPSWHGSASSTWTSTARWPTAVLRSISL
jgi:hypothetical protein